jgi:hypothetical protein
MSLNIGRSSDRSVDPFKSHFFWHRHLRAKTGRFAGVRPQPPILARLRRGRSKSTPQISTGSGSSPPLVPRSGRPATPTQVRVAGERSQHPQNSFTGTPRTCQHTSDALRCCSSDGFRNIPEAQRRRTGKGLAHQAHRSACWACARIQGRTCLC